MIVCDGGGGRVLLCAQRPYYGRDQLDCPSPNGLNHYLPLNKTGAHTCSTGEQFGATLPSCFFISLKTNEAPFLFILSMKMLIV